MNNKKKYSYIVLSALALVSILMLMTAAGCSEAGYDNAVNTTESPSTTATFGDNTSSVSEQPTQATATQTSTSATITPTQTPATPTQAPATPTQAPATKVPGTEAGNGNTNFTTEKSIIFSHPSGFYNNEFTLKLTYNPQYTVRYTRNGDDPIYTSNKYNDGIKIVSTGSADGTADRATVIRVAAFSGTTRVSEIITATFFVVKDAQSFANQFNNIAVVSISTDRKNLYGSTGIFTNYTEHGRDSERPAHVEFFDSDGTAGFSVDAGLRVYGGTSRALPQKSLKLVARKEYDPENGKFKYAMLPDSLNQYGVPVDRFDSFVLRSGGNDNIFGGGRNTLLRDALVHTLGGKMGNIAFQAYRPTIVYINGTYSGLYNLRDDTDNDYIEQHYNIPKDDVAIISYGHENGAWIYKIDEGTEEDLNNYKNMLSYINNTNMAISGNYISACKKLDMDNFMKYIAINVFANNRDWPHNNVRAWMHGGQWRFVLKDIDYSWGIYDLPGRTENVVAEETSHSENVLRGGAGEISAAFASLMKNKTFKTQFLALVDSMVNDYFSTATAEALLDNMVAIMSAEYPRLATNVWYRNPSNPAEGHNSVSMSLEEWLEATETLYEYARKRPVIFKDLVNKIYG